MAAPAKRNFDELIHHPDYDVKVQAERRETELDAAGIGKRESRSGRTVGIGDPLEEDDSIKNGAGRRGYLPSLPMRLHFLFGPLVDLRSVVTPLPKSFMHRTHPAGKSEWLRRFDKLDDHAVSVFAALLGEGVEPT